MLFYAPRTVTTKLELEERGAGRDSVRKTLCPLPARVSVNEINTGGGGASGR